MTLFSQCLSRNVFALSHSTFPPSPIALVIPHTVLSELDNLKTSSRGNVATAAREANRWILSALQTQKKQMYDVYEQGQTRRETIPESSWVLHIENTAHTSALQQVHGPLSALVSNVEDLRERIL
jgi:predicted ribonuclease YlaK